VAIVPRNQALILPKFRRADHHFDTASVILLPSDFGNANEKLEPESVCPKNIVGGRKSLGGLSKR
jgi:hypothetical protein